jgi:SAM-dependent methyltransferase
LVDSPHFMEAAIPDRIARELEALIGSLPAAQWEEGSPDPTTMHARELAPELVRRHVASEPTMSIWEREAENWTRWAREPGHDAYWSYRDSFFDDVLPPAGDRTLDIGCGEGRVSRDLASRGHRVTGVDLSPTLARHARAADELGAYVAADAASLPFRDGSFDLAVAYNSLQNVLDLHGAAREAARVLRPAGRLCICMTHPTADAGHFESTDPGADFLIDTAYLEPRWLHATCTRDGLTMTFAGPAHPLEEYSRALEGAGFLIEVIREPKMAPRADPSDTRWQRIPMFMFLRAVRS